MESIFDDAAGTNNESAQPNLPLKFLTASSLIGDGVRNKENEDLGQIKDIMINVQTGSIEYYIIEFGGFLGIGEKFFAIPFKLLTIDPKEQVFIFDQKREMLEKAPGFQKDHWPETNRHFYDADKHWNFM